MSDTTAALEDAIRAHVADLTGDDAGPVAHWVLVAGVLDTTNGDIPILIEGPDGQPGYIAAGLLHAALHPDNYNGDDEED